MLRFPPGRACTSRTWSRATCCGPWASATSWPTAASASAWAASTTEEEVDYVIDHVVEAVNHLRAMSPLYEMAKEGIDLKNGSMGNALKAACGLARE